MKLLVSILLVLGFGAVLFITNPSRAEIDQEIESYLLGQIDSLEVQNDTDPAVQILLGTCKLGRDTCAGLLRSLLSVTVEDKTLASKVTVQLGSSDPVICWGILTRMICPDG